ncbi:P-loop NTPase fold protein [uncultured Thiohalocapsa sp.]|uniref:P-loop NTPase fold protein n=1 Tax=uncultured Thiohalocapsa sp. TaxID=768990 RepID=UPI0025DA0626|nr:P-loop NTPase fold protein [uncultured Thiohalocapsa sp.]
MSESRELLAGRLNEAPVDEALLWKLYWGMDGEEPQVLTRLAAAVVGSEHSGHALISGRYGVGKTSFLRALLTHLENHPLEPLQLWLTMPLITSYTSSSAVAAVIGAMVENLCADAPLVHPDGWHPDRVPEDNKGLDPMILQALEDLWRSEGPFEPACDGGSGNEPLRPNRMAGAASAVSRVYRSNTIEQMIDRRLGWAPDRLGTPLVVYLDDLDRCKLDVAEAVIQLLLRFRSSRAVRFVIACDRELMERGVLAWMDKNGTHADGHVYVTANSALEKYLDVILRLPRLSEPAAEAAAGAGFLGLRPGLLELLRVPRKDFGTVPESVLERCAEPGGERRAPDPDPILAEYLLTWLLDGLDEDRLVWRRSDPDDPPPPPGAPAPLQAPEVAGLDDDAQAAPDNEEPPTPSVAHGADHPGTPAGAPPASKEGTFEDPASFQDPNKARPAEKIFLAKLTPLAEGLRQLVCLDERRGLLRLRPAYRALASALTPRQLKAYLRARLVQSGGTQGGPAETLLEQEFHLFWRVKREEPEIFRFIAAAANAAGSQTQVGFRQLALFFDQLRALIESSTILTEDRLREVWPENHEERVLLLRLLDALHAEQRGAQAPRVSARGTVAPALEGGRDPEFADWVRGHFGRMPQGATVAEQVSSFQDYALARHRNGVRDVFPIVGEYADRYLERHLPYFAQSTATSLSNLAVLIDDQAPFEAECDALFDAAVHLNPQHGSIPLYYADFLTKAYVEEPRRGRLIPARFPDDGVMLDRCEALLATVSAEDGATRLHLATLRLQLDKARGLPDAELIPKVQDVVDAHMGRLLVEARIAQYASLTRFDSMLDMVIGRDSTNLPRKGTILGVIWAVLETCRASPWVAAMFVANNYVGQSRSNSSEERLGLRVNLGLLADLDMLAAAPDRTAEIWTQTLLTWAGNASERGSSIASRVALGLLAAQVYGRGGGAYAARAAVIWQRIQADGEPDNRRLLAALSDKHKDALAALSEKPTKPAVIEQARDAVFQDDIGTPVTDSDTFAKLASWPAWADQQPRIMALAAELCGAPGEAGHD